MLTLVFWTVLLASDVVFALTNISVDDTSSMIDYVGDWEPSRPSSFAFGGSHALCETRGCTATFSFTGVAVYFLSPLWPFAVSTEISLDGGSGVTINLTDPLATPTSSRSESAPWRPVWGATGLSDSSHSLVASMPDNGLYVVVDGFIYTIDNDPSSSESTSSTTLPLTQETSTAGALSFVVTTKAGETFTSTTTTTSLVSSLITGTLGVTTKASNASYTSTLSTAPTTSAPPSSQTASAADDSSPGATTKAAVDHKSTTALIAGVVVGALVLIAVIAMSLYYCQRRRRKLEAERARFTVTSFLDPQIQPMTSASSPIASGKTYYPATPLLRVEIPSNGGQVMISESESETEVSSSPPAYNRE